MAVLSAVALGLTTVWVPAASAAAGQPVKVLAAQAGMDLILCSARDVTEGEDATQGLVRALEDGRLDPIAFRIAVKRISILRNSLS